MKTKLSIIITLLLSLSVFSVIAAAQETDTISVRMSQRKKAPRSKVRVKLLSVLEDSRCPEGTNCIWAGNARVKVELSFNGKVEVVELNTNTGRRGGQVDYWAVNLESLTPAPKAGVTLNPRRYVARFTIVRIQR